MVRNAMQLLREAIDIAMHVVCIVAGDSACKQTNQNVQHSQFKKFADDEWFFFFLSNMML